MCGEQKSNEGDDTTGKTEAPPDSSSWVDIGYRRSDTINTNGTIGTSLNGTEVASDTTTNDANVNSTSAATILNEVAANVTIAENNTTSSISTVLTNTIPVNTTILDNNSTSTTKL